MKMLYGKKKTIVLYNKEQMKTFLQAAKSYHSCYLEILLALFCGLRTGEILALRYTDFNSKNRTVTISQQYTRDYKYDKKESGEKEYGSKFNISKKDKTIMVEMSASSKEDEFKAVLSTSTDTTLDNYIKTMEANSFTCEKK